MNKYTKLNSYNLILKLAQNYAFVKPKLESYWSSPITLDPQETV